MSSHEEVLAEELEVLESIYADELEKLSAEEIRIRIEPEEDVALVAPSSSAAGAKEDEAPPEPIQLFLHVNYTSGYPDEIPKMTLEGAEEVDEKSREEMLTELKGVAEESLGMAMVFTLASHLRESLTSWIRRTHEEAAQKENARREAELEAEQEKFRGTSVTRERFLEWRAKFEVERKASQTKQEEERIKGMTGKEREEFRRLKAKPTGRQLFEKGDIKEPDIKETEGDDDAEEIDWTLYSREERERERLRAEEEERNRVELERLNFDDEDDD